MRTPPRTLKPSKARLARITPQWLAEEIGTADVLLRYLRTHELLRIRGQIPGAPSGKRQ